MGQPAARIGDLTSHGTPLGPGPGCPTVLIGGKPAWRAGADVHVCPLSDGPKPHVGGSVAVGSATVLIGGLPAARQGDQVRGGGCAQRHRRRPTHGRDRVAMTISDERGREFLGSGWAFPPRIAGETGLVAPVSYEEDIQQSILIILTTAKGERVMRPDFGCGIHDLVFAAVTAQVVAQIETTVRDALRTYEARIDVRARDGRDRPTRPRAPRCRHRLRGPGHQPARQLRVPVLLPGIGEPMSSHPVLPPPSVDPRRAAALRAQLRRLASALTPRWAQTEERDDFASALLAIAARLGEETTRRLDQTPERDALAFFDFLGLPPLPPHAATGVLAMALAEGAVLPAVFAPSRTQLTVTDAGRRPRAVRDRERTSGRARQDSQNSRRRPGRRSHRAGSGAGHRADTARSGAGELHGGEPGGRRQPDPAAQPGGRAGPRRHPPDRHRRPTGSRTVDKDTGIVTLQDPLEAPVAADTTVSRIASFPSFALRNLQHHAFYVGHSALFDLKQPAEISLVFTPTRLARELTGLAVTYSMWGTKEGRVRARLATAGAARHQRRHRQPGQARLRAPSTRSRSTDARAAGCASTLSGPVPGVRSLSSPRGGDSRRGCLADACRPRPG